jgi:hypothetical protein
MPSNSEVDPLEKVLPLARSLAEVCWTHGIQCHGPISYKNMVFDRLTVDETGGVSGEAHVKVGKNRVMVRFGFPLDPLSPRT